MKAFGSGPLVPRESPNFADGGFLSIYLLGINLRGQLPTTAATRPVALIRGRC